MDGSEKKKNGIVRCTMPFYHLFIERVIDPLDRFC
jgi:hypothetical protein